MNLIESKLWISDLNKSIESLLELDELAGKNILITGGTGLICSAVVDILTIYNEENTNKINIFVAGRSFERIENRFRKGIMSNYIHFVPYEATASEITLDFDVDYIIHGASSSLPNQYVNEPVETVLSNFIGVKALLDIFKRQGYGKLLYISSSEVYGKKESFLPFKENEYGYVDILNQRSSYPMGKRAAEVLCAAYYHEYNVQTVIVRPGHIYGPTASAKDTRVSSAWAYDVANGHNIYMKSDGKQIRSYCYCLDCATAILKVLLCGKISEAYNISNPDSIISIKDMAKLLCKYGEVDLVQENADVDEKKNFNPMMNSSLDSEKLLGLGWRGLFNAEIGFEHTVKILKKSICKENDH